MEPIQIEYQYTEAVSVRAAIEISKSTSKSFVIMPWLGVVILMLGLVNIGISPKGEASDFIILFLGVFFILLPRFGIRTVKRNFKKNPIANRTIRWRIDEAGLKNETEGASSLFNWDKLVKIVERKTGFILFITVRLGYWIPKDAFRSEEEMDDFRNLARKQNVLS